MVKGTSRDCHDPAGLTPGRLRGVSPPLVPDCFAELGLIPCIRVELE